MEDLTKQQIVLLTLFVSFVTSIATGIVAVSLMNQAPVGVTQTINRIVERTIERVSSEPASTTAVTASAVDALPVQKTPAQAVAKISKSIVRLRSKNSSLNDGNSSVGMGIVISKEGVIVTDKMNTGVSDLIAVFPDGKEFPIQVIQTQLLGDIVYAIVIVPRDYVFYPVTYSGEDSLLHLGETLLTIGGKDSNTLEQGLLSKVQTKSADPIETTISSKSVLIGSPLFTTEGDIVGMKTSSLISENSFYPFSVLKSIAPTVTR